MRVAKPDPSASAIGDRGGGEQAAAWGRCVGERRRRTTAAFRPLSPGRLCSTRARAASVQLRAGSSRGRRPWPGGGAPAADPAEHRGRRHARAAVPPSSFLFFSLARSRLLSVLETLTSSPAARQRRSGGRPPAQQLGVGACASDDDGPLVSSAAGHRADHRAPWRRETRSLAAAAATAATRPRSSSASCCGPERAPTQADRTTSKRTAAAAAARDTDRGPCSTTPAVDWRPAPRPSSPARAHSHAPAVRPTGRPPWAYRARSHPALASSIIGRAHMVTSSCQISRRQQQRIAAAAGLFHAAKKKSGLRRSTF